MSTSDATRKAEKPPPSPTPKTGAVRIASVAADGSRSLMEDGRPMDGISSTGAVCWKHRRVQTLANSI